MDKTTTYPDDQTPQHYGCFAAGWPLLLPPKPDATLCYRPTVYPQPHSYDEFPGLIEYGGWPLPLFDLQPIAHPQAAAHNDLVSQPTWVIVWGQGRDALGLRLDSLPISVADVQPARFPHTLPSLLRSCVRSSFSAGQQHWLAVDPVKLGQQLSRLASSSK